MRDTIGLSGPGQGPAPRRLEGWHVLALLLAFFAVVLVVNGWFLVSALGTHSGLVAVEPYRRGLAYNARIAAGERQAAVGWRDRIEVASTGAVSAAITDAGGGAVGGLIVTGSISRPATTADERVLRLAEVAPGGYAASVGALAAGSWIVSLEARASLQDAEPIYRARRRLWLKP